MLGCIVLCTCGDPAGGEFAGALERETRKREGTPDAAPLILADMTDFSWDRVFIFPPYTRIENIDAALGFAWQGARQTRIDERDDVSLLVFARDGEVALHVLYPRRNGDFSGIHASGGLAAAEAIFAVQGRGNAAPPVLVLVTG